MILLAAVLGGALVGYRAGAGSRAVSRFVVAWLVVFALQTAFLVATQDNPRDRDTGAWDLGYFPFSLVVLALGLLLLKAAAALSSARRARAGSRSG